MRRIDAINHSNVPSRQTRELKGNALRCDSSSRQHQVPRRKHRQIFLHGSKRQIGTEWQPTISKVVENFECIEGRLRQASSSDNSKSAIERSFDHALLFEN